MKKIIGILVGAGVLISIIATSSIAQTLETSVDEYVTSDGEYLDISKSEMGEEPTIIEEAPPAVEDSVVKEEKSLRLQDVSLIKERNRFRNVVNEEKYNKNRKGLKFRGIWGFAGDNESDGYFGGRIIKHKRALVLKGVYNKTGSEEYGKVFGIMRKGYFNGKVISPEGEKCHITGLYKFDRQNNTFRMKWMTPHANGWAGAKIIVSEG